MAITVIKEPSTITPSRNPVFWKLSTDAYITATGAVASRTFTFTGNPTALDWIRMIWNDADITFSALISPSAYSGYNFPTNTGGLSLSTYVLSLVPWMQANYYIKRDFIVSAVGDTLIFTARERGSLYNTTATESMANGSFTAQTTGTEDTVAENFQIAVDVYVENTYGSGIYTRLSTKYFKPDSSQIVEFDIQDQLHAFLEKETNAPTINQTAYSTCSNINKRYYITYAEYHGSTPVFHRVYTSSVNKVIKGGLKHELWPNYANFRTNFLVTLKPFLITRRVRRTATVRQYEHLYFVPGAAIVNARIKARVEYSNHAPIITTVASYSMLSAGLTYLFPASWHAMGLNALSPSSTALRWYVWLENIAGSMKSEMICYDLTEDTHLQRFFWYENSLGGWETLRTIGQMEHSVDIKKKEFEGILPNTYTAEQGNIVSKTESWQDVNEVYTGHDFTKEEAQDLIDLMKGEKIFELVNDKKVPINIEAADILPLDKDDAYVYGIKFKYRPAYKQVNYGWR